MVARRDDQGVLELTACLQLLHQHPQPRVHRQALAKIVSRILADLVNVRQKIWQPALEIVWFDAPERFARSTLPRAMRVRRLQQRCFQGFARREARQIRESID